MNIIESISNRGVKTTPAALMHVRMSRPNQGDVIDFGDNVGNYPFKAKYGRIDSVETGFADSGEVHVCCHMGSAFLYDNGNVSISGGPFACVKLADLEPLYETHTAEFWNWGNLGAGAGHGVYYSIARPVFKLRLQKEGDKP